MLPRNSSETHLSLRVQAVWAVVTPEEPLVSFRYSLFVRVSIYVPSH